MVNDRQGTLDSFVDIRFLQLSLVQPGEILQGAYDVDQSIGRKRIVLTKLPQNVDQAHLRTLDIRGILIRLNKVLHLFDRSEDCIVIAVDSAEGSIDLMSETGYKKSQRSHLLGLN